jgi:hypothetical protein
MKSSPPVSSQNRWADWLFPSCTAGKWASGKDNHGGFQQVQLSATDPREVLHGIADPRAWNSGKDAVLSSLYLAWEIHIFLQWLSWYVLVNHSVCPRTHLSSTQLTDLNFHLAFAPQKHLWTRNWSSAAELSHTSCTIKLSLRTKDPGSQWQELAMPNGEIRLPTTDGLPGPKSASAFHSSSVTAFDLNVYII